VQAIGQLFDQTRSWDKLWSGGGDKEFGREKGGRHQRFPLWSSSLMILR